MSLTRILTAFALFSGLCQSMPAARAEIQQAAAAGYIRALFDANMAAGADTARICPEIAELGRFAAGHAWQDLSSDERRRFAVGFCDLAAEAVSRLRKRWPDLHLVIERTADGPQDLQVVSGLVRQPNGVSWPVEWAIASDGDRAPHLADLKIVGVSLGIFLRSVALLQQDSTARGAVTAHQLIAAWRRALDRALPSAITPED